MASELPPDSSDVQLKDEQSTSGHDLVAENEYLKQELKKHQLLLFQFYSISDSLVQFCVDKHDKLDELKNWQLILDKMREETFEKLKDDDVDSKLKRMAMAKAGKRKRILILNKNNGLMSDEMNKIEQKTSLTTTTTTTPNTRLKTRKKRQDNKEERQNDEKEEKQNEEEHQDKRQRKDVEEELFSCDFINCRKKFKSNQRLAVHKRVHFKGKQPTKIDEEYLKRPFHCDHPNCGKSFRHQSEFKRHTLRHSGIKKMLCPWPGCSAKFVENGDLKKHMKWHVGDKKFVCEFPGCGKRFLHSSNLNLHSRYHLPEPVFHCEWPGCHYATNNKSNLKTHTSKHSKNGTNKTNKITRNRTITTTNIIVNEINVNEDEEALVQLNHISPPDPVYSIEISQVEEE